MSQFDDLAVEEEGPQDECVLLQPQKSDRRKGREGRREEVYSSRSSEQSALGSASDLLRMRKVSKCLVAFLASSSTESVCLEPKRYGDHSRDWFTCFFVKQCCETASLPKDLLSRLLKYF